MFNEHDAAAIYGFNERYAVTKQLGEFANVKEYPLAARQRGLAYELVAFTFTQDPNLGAGKALAVVGDTGYLAVCVCDSAGGPKAFTIIEEQYANHLERLCGHKVEQDEFAQLFYRMTAYGLAPAQLLAALESNMRDPKTLEVVAIGGFHPDHFSEGWRSPLEQYATDIASEIWEAQKEVEADYRLVHPRERRFGGAVPKKREIQT